MGFSDFGHIGTVIFIMKNGLIHGPHNSFRSRADEDKAGVLRPAVRPDVERRFSGSFDRQLVRFVDLVASHVEQVDALWQAGQRNFDIAVVEVFEGFYLLPHQIHQLHL